MTDTNKPPKTESHAPLSGVRESAMAWWNELPNNINDGMCKFQLSWKFFDRNWQCLTGREIQEIYEYYKHSL